MRAKYWADFGRAMRIYRSEAQDPLPDSVEVAVPPVDSSTQGRDGDDDASNSALARGVKWAARLILTLVVLAAKVAATLFFLALLTFGLVLGFTLMLTFIGIPFGFFLMLGAFSMTAGGLVLTWGGGPALRRWREERQDRRARGRPDTARGRLDQMVDREVEGNPQGVAITVSNRHPEQFATDKQHVMTRLEGAGYEFVSATEARLGSGIVLSFRRTSDG